MGLLVEAVLLNTPDVLVPGVCCGFLCLNKDNACRFHGVQVAVTCMPLSPSQPLRLQHAVELQSAAMHRGEGWHTQVPGYDFAITALVEGCGGHIVE